MDTPRIGQNAGLQATYSATANFGNGQATGQGFPVLDTYPGRWISVQVTGLGAAGSAGATFGFSHSNSPSVGFAGGFLQQGIISATTNATYQSSLITDGILNGPIRARYVQWVTVTAATAGPTSSPVTAFITVWDHAGQCIG